MRFRSLLFLYAFILFTPVSRAADWSCEKWLLGSSIEEQTSAPSARLAEAFQKLNRFWSHEFERRGIEFFEPRLIITDGPNRYFWGLHTIELRMAQSDLTLLTLAHEYSHHIQNLLGLLTLESGFKSIIANANKEPKSEALPASNACVAGTAKGYSVLYELQADMMAGYMFSVMNPDISSSEVKNLEFAILKLGDDYVGLPREDYQHGESCDRCMAFRAGREAASRPFDFADFDTFARRDLQEKYFGTNQIILAQASELLAFPQKPQTQTAWAVTLAATSFWRSWNEREWRAWLNLSEQGHSLIDRATFPGHWITDPNHQPSESMKHNIFNRLRQILKTKQPIPTWLYVYVSRNDGLKIPTDVVILLMKNYEDPAASDILLKREPWPQDASDEFWPAFADYFRSLGPHPYGRNYQRRGFRAFVGNSLATSSSSSLWELFLSMESSFGLSGITSNTKLWPQVFRQRLEKSFLVVKEQLRAGRFQQWPPEVSSFGILRQPSAHSILHQLGLDGDVNFKCLVLVALTRVERPQSGRELYDYEQAWNYVSSLIKDPNADKNMKEIALMILAQKPNTTIKEKILIGRLTLMGTPSEKAILREAKALAR